MSSAVSRSASPSAPDVPEFRPVAGVYALIDPRSNRVMYVGQSLDVYRRFDRHCDLSGNYELSNVEKRNWIKGLSVQGLKPRLALLAECLPPESDEVERQAIRSYRLNGQCELNLADGGLGARSVSRLKRSHPDDWFELGRTVRLAERILGGAVVQAQDLAGVKGASYVMDALGQINTLKSRLENLMLKVHPDLEEFAQVFYGDDGQPGIGPGVPR